MFWTAKESDFIFKGIEKENLLVQKWKWGLFLVSKEAIDSLVKNFVVTVYGV